MNRTVLITGASSGIGRAMAQTFAANGDKLILLGRRLERLEALKSELEAQFSIDVWVYQLDVTQIEAVKEVSSLILAQHGSIDILINNAGLALGLEPYQDSKLDDSLIMIDTNVRGLLAVTRQFLPKMVKKNQGHIINIGSTAGIYAYAGAAVYAATKAAVRFISDGIRIDTMASNIKVTTLQPGIVETDFSQVRFKGDQERAKSVYAGVEALQAEDIANCALFVVNQPAHVQISDMTIMARQQATGFLIHREEKENKHE
ncbi:TPA: SDR family NAD(P)-dependent oxidoreductase [Streptococcus suis]